MGDAVDLVSMAIEAGSRITVHGDFDVDGVCATAITGRRRCESWEPTATG